MDATQQPSAIESLLEELKTDYPSCDYEMIRIYAKEIAVRYRKMERALQDIRLLYDKRYEAYEPLADGMDQLAKDALSQTTL